ncbi:hypothetical protein [Enterococcus casseliflavus]|uniref:hypothetical protein n=1 Tax=Enterococcus casseliflavus TaxID=37734 RepID=UPI003BF533FB
MKLNILSVNKRAIDSDELFQLIDNSGGIYESTLIKLLQCNRISLESRLQTLENNKMITKQKLGKYFYYTNSFESNNLQLLDIQADVIQKLIKYAIFTDNIRLIANHDKQKEFLVSCHSSGRTNFSTNEQLKNQANILYNQLASIEKKELFLEFVKNELTKFPMKISAITNKVNIDYHTSCLYTIEILALPNADYLPIIEARLDDFSYKKLDKNRQYVRDDILVYIQSLNRFYYFNKNQNRQYETKKIGSIMDFYYALCNYSKAKNSFYFSLDKNDFNTAHYLYYKSDSNRRKYNTVQIKRNKQKTHS